MIQAQSSGPDMRPLLLTEEEKKNKYEIVYAVYADMHTYSMHADMHTYSL